MMGTERPDYEAWKEWSEGDFGKFSFHQDAYYRAEVFDRCSTVPGTKLLEIGYGNGSLLGFSRSLGLEVAGVELNPVLQQRAVNAGFRVFASTDSLPDSHFDVAVALDVMEHVPDSQSIEFLTDIKRGLKPGGLLILRFPNGDSPFGRALQYGDVLMSVLSAASRSLTLPEERGSASSRWQTKRLRPTICHLSFV